VLETNLFTTLHALQAQLLQDAADKYGVFMDLPVTVTEHRPG